jgi:hypothetical protein
LRSILSDEFALLRVLWRSLQVSAARSGRSYNRSVQKIVGSSPTVNILLAFL